MCGVCSGLVPDYCATDEARIEGAGGGQLTGLEIFTGQAATGGVAHPFGGVDAMTDAITRADAKWGDVGFGTAGGEVSFSFSGYRGGGAIQFTEEGRALVVDALCMIADVADMSFVWEGTGEFATTDGERGDIVYTQYGTNPLGGGVGGWSGGRATGDATWTIDEGYVDVGGQSLSLFLHETMHALGMSHPGDYNGRGVTYADDAAYWDDTAQFTVMSYFGAHETGANYGRTANTNLMLYDIAALQEVYGANMTTRTGDTVYGFNSTARVEGSLAQAGTMGAAGEIDASWRLDGANDTIVGAIWDAGGRDTIDLSGFDTASQIDLREGGFSSFGGLTNNLAVAYGAVIESAVGGAGDDVLRGNDVANRLFGGAGDDVLTGAGGNDVLVGGAGADRLEGGAGFDTVTYAAARGAVRVDMTGTDWAGEAAGDTFVSVENLVGSRGWDVMRADGGANGLWGRAGNDSLFGGGGNDRLFGEDGHDILFGGAGADILNGGRGRDFVSYTDSTQGVLIDMLDRSRNAGDAAGDRLFLIENLVGTNHDDTVLGGNVGNVLFGRHGADVIDGRGGADLIDGGGGADLLTGGQGFDTFRYRFFGESTAARTDTITDFERGRDTIDLSAVDADTGAAGNQAFAWIGTAGFSGSAGELRHAATAGGVRVEADIDGDGAADMVIALADVDTLTASDFAL